MTISDPTAPDTIVLIHGFWVTPRSWEEWIAYYQDKGYRVLAPAYPGFEVEVEALKADPTPIENLTVPAVIDHLTEVIGGLERPPILMGHSAGGVFTQLMLDRGYGAVGVVMDSAPTEGVPVVPLSQLKSTFPALRTVGRKKAAGFTFEQWHYAFCNTFPEERSRQLYERYHIPASVRVLWGSALATLEPGGRRCCSSPAPTTTSCRPRCSAPTPSTTSPRRLPRWWSSTGRTCFRPATAGRRSPTTPWSGPSATHARATPGKHQTPAHDDNPHHPHRGPDGLLEVGGGGC
jgi:pimeloyl-ACP methyl ester carboxylesterase